jgi:hypothetical protein
MLRRCAGCSKLGIVIDLVFFLFIICNGQMDRTGLSARCAFGGGCIVFLGFESLAGLDLDVVLFVDRRMVGFKPQ